MVTGVFVDATGLGVMAGCEVAGNGQRGLEAQPGSRLSITDSHVQ